MLNDPPIKIDDFGRSRGIQTHFRELGKQVFAGLLVLKLNHHAPGGGFGDLRQGCAGERFPQE